MKVINCSITQLMHDLTIILYIMRNKKQMLNALNVEHGTNFEFPKCGTSKYQTNQVKNKVLQRPLPYLHTSMF